MTHALPHITSGRVQLGLVQAPPPSKNSQQAPFWHVRPDGQTAPHAPQLKGSLVVSMQPSVQQVSVPGHLVTWHVGVWHTPDTHVVPALHCTPQPPQFCVSLVSSTQVAPQQERPSWQMPPEQLSGMHVCVVGAHTSPGGHVSGAVRHATQVPCGTSQ